MERPAFDPSDRFSPYFIKQEAWLAERIELLRLKNERSLDPVETANLRGRIEELRVMQALVPMLPQSDTA